MRGQALPGPAYAIAVHAQLPRYKFNVRPNRISGLAAHCFHGFYGTSPEQGSSCSLAFCT